MMKFILGALVFMSISAHAADVYKVDTAASSVSWKGTKKMGSFHHGGISLKEGEVTIDKKGTLSAGNFVIDMKTITNEDLKDSPEYQKKLVGHLSNEDFFNVEKFPTTTFKVTNVTTKNKETIVKGELTMIGQTHPIEFPVTMTVDKGVATGEAIVKVNRTKWGLKYGSGNFFKELAGDKIINDEFELTLKLVAKK